MLRCTLIVFALLLPAVGQAQTDFSSRIAANGLGPTEDALAQLPDPTPDDRFALGGVRFLRAIETALQTRYRYGLSGEALDFPVLRLDIAANPRPEPFDPAVIEQIFARLVEDMAAAAAPLSEIGDEDVVALRIGLGDLWFDVNMNGTRDPEEGLTALTGAALFPRRSGGPEGTAPVVQFDTADAAWLSAYTHLLSGFGELVLAFSPTDAIARVRASAEQMRVLSGGNADGFAADGSFVTRVDIAMMVYLALGQNPDPAGTRAARDHWLSMIRENRRFWTLVERETDNDAEWIPNAGQTSALGIEFPPETGATWQAVLADAEALLEGRKLIPHWRYGLGAGINLRKLMEDPIPVRPAEWVQGMGLMAYAEPGTRVDAASWRRFSQMARGDSMLLVLLLN